MRYKDIEVDDDGPDLVAFLHNLAGEYCGKDARDIELAALELASAYRQIETLTFDLAEARGETVHYVEWKEPR